MNAHNIGITKAGNRGGTLMKLLVFFVVFGCVIAAAWVYFLPVVLASTLQKHTGFRVKITQMAFNPFTARVDLTGLVISNPPGFPRPHFIEVTSFNANAQMQTLFSNHPVFDYARIEVAYVALVRDADGVLNSQLFNDRLNPPPRAENEGDEKKKLFGKDEPVRDASATQGGPVKPKAEPAKTSPADPKARAKTGETAAKDKKSNSKEAEVVPVEKPMRFTIRRLELSLDRVIVADYMAATPDIREYKCKLHYTFNDFTDPKQLMAPFAFKSLQSVGAAIQGLIPGDIGKAFGAATQPVDPMLKPKTEQAADPLKTVVEKLEESQKP
ncbi:MAG: hypothetical protein QM715_08500 [Nibricoccus sp.]